MYRNVKIELEFFRICNMNMNNHIQARVISVTMTLTEMVCRTLKTIVQWCQTRCLVTRMVCMAVPIKLPYRTDHTYHRMVNNFVKQGPESRLPWEGRTRNVSQIDKEDQC